MVHDDESTLPNPQAQQPPAPQTQTPSAPTVPPQAAQTESVSAEVSGPNVSTEGQLLVFSRKTVQREITITLRSTLYKGYKPWVFKCRLQLSSEAQSAREKWLGLTNAEVNRTVKSQQLNELADLLIELDGFGDIPPDIIGGANKSVGQKLKDYYVSTANDPELRFTLERIIAAANDAYWNAISPREF